MSKNRLKLNLDKTEFIWLGSKHNLGKVHIDTIQLGSCSIKVAATVRNVGVIFDNEMNLNAQVSSVVRSCFYQLRQLRSIQRFLTTDAIKTLVHAFVCSRVDYCNSVLLESTGRNYEKLQSILNAAARLIVGRRKFDHICDVLQGLHWLRVPQRCQFKVACVTRRCLLGTGPDYLASYLVPVSTVSARSHLRSAARGNLVVPKHRTKTARRSFMYTGPTTWNDLPREIRDLNNCDTNFISSLKTHLFAKSFNL